MYLLNCFITVWERAKHILKSMLISTSHLALRQKSSGNNPIDHFDVCIGNLLYLSSSGKSNFMIALDIYKLK